MRSRDRADAGAEAFAWFFAAEYPRVVRSLSHLVRREDAEDVAQEAFARLHQHWAKVSRYERPDAWVRRVALNQATSLATREGKRYQRERRADLGARDVAAPVVPDTRVGDALRTLPVRQRMLVVLYYYEDRPLSDAAELVDMTPGAAKVALHRARQALARLLDEETSDELA
ncbi:MAG TPA: sigma-70 family RNA polymerase sigma factor [Nocardioides sp.]